MKLNLRVTFHDESAVDVVASAADLVAFESKWDKSVVTLGDGLRMTDLCWLAWHSLNRRKQTPLDFEPWLDTIDMVAAGKAEDIVPLETSQPTG